MNTKTEIDNLIRQMKETNERLKGMVAALHQMNETIEKCLAKKEDDMK